MNDNQATSENADKPNNAPAPTNNSQIENQQFFMPLTSLPAPPELKDLPGAKTWLMDGSKNGVLATSVMIATVAPGEGPPLHLHFTEEVQFIIEGAADFIVGDARFQIAESGVVHIPANTAHAFVNTGKTDLRVVTFFPTATYDTNWKVVGANPLIKTTE